MANSEQITSLIRCHFEGDNHRFRTLALQVAASEARAGHSVLAQTIKDIVNAKNGVQLAPRLKMLNSEVADYLIETDCNYRLVDLVAPNELREKIKRIILEYVQREKLRNYNLENRHRILMTGPSGTGKTMTASVVAKELELPLYVVRTEKVLTKFMGETSLKLSQIFDFIRQVRGIYLFDEFDAIGQRRSFDNEVGEMRRVLNSFLQMMERDCADSMILAATNDLSALDSALFRRFDEVLHYSLPTNEERVELIKRRFATFQYEGDISQVLPDMAGMCQAEVCMVCDDAIKESILMQKPLTIALLREMAAKRVSSKMAV